MLLLYLFKNFSLIVFAVINCNCIFIAINIDSNNLSDHIINNTTLKIVRELGIHFR